MDDWRRRLERRNRARAVWPRMAASLFMSVKWGKIIIGLVIVVAAIWLLRDNSVTRLRDQDMPDIPLSSTAEELPDGFGLYAHGQYDAAFSILLPLANQGDGRAQCMVGKMLAQGLGSISVDHIEGVKWLDLCIRDRDYDDDEEARDLTDNIINTAGWDVAGEGRYRAFQWQQAHINAQNGQPGSASESVVRDLDKMDAGGAFALGADLNAGNNMPVDYAKALDCFRRAAEFGIAESTFNVGLSYYVGKGVKAEPKEARRWLQIAADGGYAKAASLLGVMTARGHGTEPDIDAALAYLNQAAQLGDADAVLLKEAITQGIIPR